MSEETSQPPQHVMAIIGDSYCASYQYRGHPSPERRLHQYFWSTVPTWVDLVLDHYNDLVDIHGYGGRSWWYSWHRFYDHWHYRMNQLQALIFCHTSPHRINNSWNDPLCLMPTYTDTHISGSVSESELKKAHDLYYKHIHDYDFSQFAHNEYAHSLKRLPGHVKIVNFLCFEQPPEFVAALPGTVFTTPLYEISHSTGLTLEDTNKLPNHFTPEINRAFGRLVIDAVENYRPGARPIDLTQFGLQ